MGWWKETIDIVKENDPAARNSLEVLLTYPGIKSSWQPIVFLIFVEAWVQAISKNAQSILALLDSDRDSPWSPD